MDKPELVAKSKKAKLVSLLDSVHTRLEGSEYLDKGGWKVPPSLEAGPKEWNKDWDKGWSKWGK